MDETTRYLENTLTLRELATPYFAVLKRKDVEESDQPKAKRQRTELSIPTNGLKSRPKRVQRQPGKENRGVKIVKETFSGIRMSKIRSNTPVRQPPRQPLLAKPGFQSIRAPILVKPRLHPIVPPTHPYVDQQLATIRALLPKPPPPPTKKYEENPVLPYVTRPDLYDSSWLSQQEIVFTQLINSTFEKANLNVSTQVHTKDDANLLRKLTFAIFQSECVDISQKIAATLENSTLRAKRDVDLRLDIGLFRKFADLCLCYRTEWLALGLEVVTGRQTTQLLNAQPSQLESFIFQFVVNSPSFIKDSDSPELVTRFTISRFVLLVLVLDIAKRRNIIKGCLFTISSPCKTSINILERFSNIFLCGEREIGRRLAHMDYHVDYIQTPLDEYEYRVRNLAVDLRDGVRIAKLIELLKGEKSLFPELQYPANSKAQKLHNVAMVLSYLRHRSIPLLTKDKQAVLPEDIVLGHREKSMTVLWKIISTWNLHSLLHTVPINNEIQRLEKQIVQDGVEIPQDYMDGLDEAEVLLFKWAFAICTINAIPMENLTTSLTDGRVFTAILQYYISPTTGLYKSALSALPRSSPSESLKSLSEKLGLSSLLSNLGFFKDHSLQFLDKNCAVVCLAILASSLLLFSKSSQAAFTIQRAWNCHLFQKKIKAACDGYPGFWLAKKEREEREIREYNAEIRTRKAVNIQRVWRGFVARRHFSSLKQVVSKISRRYRVHPDRVHFLNLKRAVGVIEQQWRAKSNERRKQRGFLDMRKWVMAFQARALGYLARRRTHI
ncbi:Abnormal spindle-like microcephaly-associated [Neolecta irregularis DAH-3]|uniref:Abnormal spindle-like microcephaly-associated n=1 Tax=Neolecta irregularis (strain DAH-3) TaxID=1198029 RepID=A0A1U7LP28_NEOID|nr:Abnormal spindle-like microcephaly-associated [Neolecta irregularis DAH-3]|eukprot:OLL24404.1 Abnormal spindle-like microcephaly-associated [Neolecta irregularis DAH-3]